MKIKECMATAKTRLSVSQINLIEQIEDHINVGTIRNDLSANPGYKYTGVEDLVMKLQKDEIQPWDFCEGVRDRLNPNGKPNMLGKAKAYELIYR